MDLEKRLNVLQLEVERLTKENTELKKRSGTKDEYQKLISTLNESKTRYEEMKKELKQEIAEYKELKKDLELLKQQIVEKMFRL